MYFPPLKISYQSLLLKNTNYVWVRLGRRFLRSCFLAFFRWRAKLMANHYWVYLNSENCVVPKKPATIRYHIQSLEYDTILRFFPTDLVIGFNALTEGGVFSAVIYHPGTSLDIGKGLVALGLMGSTFLVFILSIKNWQVCRKKKKTRIGQRRQVLTHLGRASQSALTRSISCTTLMTHKNTQIRGIILVFQSHTLRLKGKLSDLT